MYTMRVTGIAYSKRFQDELLKAPENVRIAAKHALALLLQNPRANALRLHPLTGYTKPAIWKIDVFSNHSWQITFEICEGVAHLKRIATHKKIDQRPR